MTAASGFCKLSVVCLTFLGIAAISGNMHAAEFRWVAVPYGGGAGNIGQTDPSCTISTTNHPGDTITCPDGGRRVHFSIGLAGWGDALGPNTELGPWDAAVDSASLDNGSFALSPVGFANPADRLLGAYQVLNICFMGASDGLACGSSGAGPYGPGLPGVTAADCAADGGLFCVANAGFVLSCCDPIAAVRVSSIDYIWGATPGLSSTFGGSDDGSIWYGGDYVLEIPTGASGEWQIEFLDFTTDMADYYHIWDIPLDALRPGIVRVPTGRCCSVQGARTVCENGLTEGQCADRPISQGWSEGQACTGPVAPDPAHFADCPHCDPANPDDPFCDDGNACTNDTCIVEGCAHLTNYDGATECCNPADGAIIIIDGGVGCETCVCDASTGQVTCVSDCDDGDACTDDACEDGVCHYVPNYDVVTECCNPAEGSTVLCGDGNACTADICDGGICLHPRNYDVDTECCNPIDGTTVPTDDGDACTYCACHPATGVVTCGGSSSCTGFKWVGVPYRGGEGNIGQTDPSCTVEGGNVTCPNGGVCVHFQLMLRSPSNSAIGWWQATLDGAALASLVPIHFDTPADRPIGAYQVLRECFGGVSDALACGNAGAGPFGQGLPGVTTQDCMDDGGYFCAPNSAFVLTCCDPVAGVSTSSMDYTWGATRGPNEPSGQSDGSRFWYGGDVVLDVPLEAPALTEVRFLDNINLTFIVESTPGHNDIGDLSSGFVHIATGKCCSGAYAQVVCESDVTHGACAARPAFLGWEEGQVCVGSVAPDPAGRDDCDVCDPADPNDPICGDGDACTDETCTEGGACRHVPNYDVVAECCNPDDGSITAIDGGPECIDCVCDSTNGEVTCSPAADGTRCDDGDRSTVDDECAAGVCGGEPVDEIPCTTDDDCPWFAVDCDTHTGFCASQLFREKLRWAR